MSPLSSASMHARRALQVATGTGQLLKWRHDLNVVSHRSPEELLRCCRRADGELVPDEATIAGTLGDVLPEVVVFSCLVAHSAGGAILSAVAREYSRLLNENYGVKQAEVTTAVPLDADARRLIETRLRDMGCSPFALDETVDPSIVGGIVVRVGDRTIDRSVRARLQALRDSVLESEHTR